MPFDEDEAIASGGSRKIISEEEMVPLPCSECPHWVDGVCTYPDECPPW